VLDIDAEISPARRILEEVYAHMGKQKEAEAEREKALSLSGGDWRIYRRRFHRTSVTKAAAELAGRLDGTLQAQLRFLL